MSSVFFPREIRNKVTRLYAFVRSADDYVDLPIPDASGFQAFEAQYRDALQGRTTSSTIIQSFVELMQEAQFDPLWVDAFLNAMRSDLTHVPCKNLADTENYMYGSAEVVGLMMCRIMGLPETAYPSAQRLGKAMQYINFLRDIEEDRLLGRIYLPTEEIKKFGLVELTESHAKANLPQFSKFVSDQVQRFLSWVEEAEHGYHFIPSQPRAAIATATDMYKWTAISIRKNPLVVFERKLKPSRLRVLCQGTRKFMSCYFDKSGASYAAAVAPPRSTT